MPLHPLPTEVNLNVSGKGWNLLRSQLGIGETQPAELAIGNLPDATFLTGQTLSPAIRKVLRGLELNYVITDTLNFRFDRRVSRKVSLIVDSASVHLQPRYQISSPIRIVPNEVTLTGPAFLLDTIPGKIPLSLPRKTLSKDFKETMPLPYINNPLIKSDITHTVISFQISKLPPAPIPADTASTDSATAINTALRKFN